MNEAEKLIKFISTQKKVTPVKLYLNGYFKGADLEGLEYYGPLSSPIIFGEYSKLKEFVDKNKDKIKSYRFEADRANSAVPLLDLTEQKARIEPGALIRDQVEIAPGAVIMMGAVINIGSKIGENTMIDMNTVVGGRAEIGKNCHIGAGSVVAGVIEPPSAQPVIIEDDVVIGANSVILEGVRVKKGAVVAAGSVVTEDVKENSVVAGSPAKVVKDKDQKTEEKTQIVSDLRD